MLRVSIHNLLSLNVAQVVFKDLFTEQVDESLDVLCHLLHVLARCELAEVYLRERSLEELDVKLVAEEDRDIVDGFLDPQVFEYVISQLYDHLDDYTDIKTQSELTFFLVDLLFVVVFSIVTALI